MWHQPHSLKLILNRERYSKIKSFSKLDNIILAHAPKIGSKPGIHKGGHESCLTTSPAWVHTRKAKQKFLQTHWGGHCTACYLCLGEHVRNNKQRIQEDIKTFFLLLKDLIHQHLMGDAITCCQKPPSALQWAHGWKPFPDSHSKITAYESFPFLKAPDHVQIMALFYILEDSGCTAGSLKWCFKSLACLSSICVALNVPSPEAI